MCGDRPVAIAGAGSIGCFVGGMLAAAGRDVALLARPRVIEEITDNGVRLTGFGRFGWGGGSRRGLGGGGGGGGGEPAPPFRRSGDLDRCWRGAGDGQERR